LAGLPGIAVSSHPVQALRSDSRETARASAPPIIRRNQALTTTQVFTTHTSRRRHTLTLKRINRLRLGTRAELPRQQLDSAKFG